MASFLNALVFVFALLLFSGAGMFVGKHYGNVVFPFYRNLSKKMMDGLSVFSGKIPFALWELLLLLLIFLFFFSFFHRLRKKKSLLKWFNWVLRIGVLPFFLFVFLWGMNHYAPPISEDLNLEITENSKEELLSAARFYREKAEVYAPLVARKADGSPAEEDFRTLAKIAGGSFEELGKSYPIFSCSSAPVKKAVLTRPLFDYSGIVGLFVCFTGESTVTPNTYAPSMPHTMCHEVAHRCGIAGEDEANFAAFLACIQNDNNSFRYSGYYSAFLYCYNALYEEDPSAVSQLWNGEETLLRADLRGSVKHYEPYQGKTQEIADKVNDRYLKAFSEESGTKSYGEAVDYLIAYYKSLNP